MYHSQHHGLKTCLLGKSFNTLIKNVPFPSPTDVRSRNPFPLMAHRHRRHSFPLQLIWDLTIHRPLGQRSHWHTVRDLLPFGAQRPRWHIIRYLTDTIRYIILFYILEGVFFFLRMPTK